MGCIYESNGIGDDGGKCTNWCEEIEMNGCDKEGNCICSEDPDPNVMCDTYESDYVCPECGCDLNIDECNCEQ